MQRIQGEIDSLNQTADERRVTLRKLEAFVEDKSGLVEKILYVESLGATIREVGAVIEAAQRSSARNGDSTAESLRALAADLGENYGVTRRLREEVDVLAKKRLNLEQMIAELEKQRINTQQILDSRQKFMNSTYGLTDRV